MEFVIFTRAKKFPQWYPLSVVKGGQAANMLVKAMESELGRKLSGNSLVRNIGTVRGPLLETVQGRAHGCCNEQPAWVLV